MFFSKKLICILLALTFVNLQAQVPLLNQKITRPFIIPTKVKSGVYNFFKNKYRNISTNLTEFSLTPIEIGTDSTIIASLKVTFSREVEKNLYPTGLNDTFLVKDSMKLVFRFGAGIVLSGVLQKEIEYNLVYPVKSNKAGIFHNSFLLDFFLYNKIKKFNLPKQSIVFITNTYQTLGEVKISSPLYDDIFDISIKHSYGISKFNRKILNFKTPNKIKLFTDTSNYPQQDTSIIADVFFLESKLYNSSSSHGTLNRKYFEIKYDKSCNQKCKSDLNDFINNNKINGRKLFGKDLITSKFTSEETSFNFFGLLKNIQNEKLEDITSKETKYTIIERDHKYKWNTILDGEQFYDQVKVIADPVAITEDPYHFVNAEAEIALIIDDYTLTSDELINHYLPMINSITLDNSFSSKIPDYHNTEGFSDRGFLQLKINLDNTALNKLIDLTEDEFWKSIYLLTGFSKSTWYNISKYKIDLPYLKKFPKSSKYSKRIRNSAINFFKFWNELQKSKESANKTEKLRLLKNALSYAIYRGKHAFVPDLFALINYISGSDHFYFTVDVIRFALPNNEQNEFDKVISLSSGQKPDSDSRYGTQIFTVNDYFHNFENIE